MIISKQMAAILGGFALAALLGITPYSCEPQKAAVARDYALLNPQVADDTAERLDELESAARAAEIEALKQYEQADYDFMRGDAEIPREGVTTMIRTQYRKPGTAKARYVRKAIGQDFYKWCEQSAEDLRYDIAQGTCDAEDLPTDIRQKCDEYNGAFYACEWPL